MLLFVRRFSLFPCFFFLHGSTPILNPTPPLPGSEMRCVNGACGVAGCGASYCRDEVLRTVLERSAAEAEGHVAEEDHSDEEEEEEDDD